MQGLRIAILWYTQELGYKAGSSIAQDLSGGLMGEVTEGASILGMFIIGAFIDWASLLSGS
jgi:PTS system mannose-specific IID component